MTPTTRFVVLVGLAGVPLAAVPLVGLPLTLAIAPTLAVLALALADRLAGVGTPITVERQVRQVLSVGTGNPVELVVRNRGARRLKLRLVDEPPEAGTADPEWARLGGVVPGGGKLRLSYSFTPDRRGRHRFGGVHVGHVSRLGLWSVRRRLDLSEEVQVYPNIEALHRFELLARVNNLDEIGVRAVRMKGEGTEFERLREYRQGDEPRRVDWKATSRYRKLIVREMGADRNQNVVFMLDMGRMMRQSTGGLSHFDYALNTAIILGHIAQERGDNVGLLAFSDEVKRYVPLGRGRATVDTMVREAFDLEPEPVATNYRRAFRHLMAHVRKRSLLVLMTHLVPGEDRRLIRSYMGTFGRQHLPLCLFFREPALEEALESVPGSVAETFHRAAAADILLERREGIEALRHGGVMALDALPGEFSAVAIGQYLDIKARNLL